MNYSLKSPARYGLLLLALGGLFGPLVAQQNNTKTTEPKGTVPTNPAIIPVMVDTIKPPPQTNPNNRTLPNTGNPADTMRSSVPLPPEGRTRTDSILMSHRINPYQGNHLDSMNRRRTPEEGKMMPPSEGIPRDSMHKQMITNDGRSMIPSRGMSRDSMDKSMTLDKTKSVTTTNTQAKPGTKKKSASSKTKTRPARQPHSTHPPGVMGKTAPVPKSAPTTPATTTKPAPTPKSKTSDGNE